MRKQLAYKRHTSPYARVREKNWRTNGILVLMQVLRENNWRTNGTLVLCQFYAKTIGVQMAH